MLSVVKEHANKLTLDRAITARSTVTSKFNKYGRENNKADHKFLIDSLYDNLG
jgi:hypothetical protein